MSYNMAGEDRRTRIVFRKLNGEEFSPLVGFLEQQLRRADDTLAKATEVATLYRAQGRHEVLAQLLETIANHRNYS